MSCVSWFEDHQAQNLFFCGAAKPISIIPNTVENFKCSSKYSSISMRAGLQDYNYPL